MKKPFFISYEGVYVEYIKNYNRYDIPVQQYHDGYEIYLFMDGERMFFHGDNRYVLKRGDIAVIKPFELHCAESCEVEFYERYVINFQTDVFSSILTPDEMKLLFSDFNSRVLHLDDERFISLCESFKLADRLSKTKNPLAKKALYSCLLTIIIQIKAIPETLVSTVSKNVSSDIIAVLNYVNRHYAEPITLDTVTDMIHISKYHFCRIFKDATGTTFLEYLNNIRLSHAHRMLASEHLNINEVAIKCGFGSAAYFSRVFKKVHGISPRAFKQNI